MLEYGSTNLDSNSASVRHRSRTADKVFVLSKQVLRLPYPPPKTTGDPSYTNKPPNKRRPRCQGTRHRQKVQLHLLPIVPLSHASVGRNISGTESGGLASTTLLCDSVGCSNEGCLVTWADAPHSLRYASNQHDGICSTAHSIFICVKQATLHCILHMKDIANLTPPVYGSVELWFWI